MPVRLWVVVASITSDLLIWVECFHLYIFPLQSLSGLDEWDRFNRHPKSTSPKTRKIHIRVKIPEQTFLIAQTSLLCTGKTKRIIPKQHGGPLETRFILDMRTHIYARIQFTYFHIWQTPQEAHNISSTQKQWSVLACKLCLSYNPKIKQLISKINN